MFQILKRDSCCELYNKVSLVRIKIASRIKSKGTTNNILLTYYFQDKYFGYKSSWLLKVINCKVIKSYFLPVPSNFWTTSKLIQNNFQKVQKILLWTENAQKAFVTKILQFQGHSSSLEIVRTKRMDLLSPKTMPRNSKITPKKFSKS